jgi:hypothetical protein
MRFGDLELDRDLLTRAELEARKKTLTGFIQCEGKPVRICERDKTLTGFMQY